MSQSRANKKAKATKAQQAQQTPVPESTAEKGGVNWSKVLLVLTILIITLAFVLNLICTDRGFSIETTAKGINFLIHSEQGQTPLQITAQPHLNLLTVSAEKLSLTTSEFVISETNQPDLKGARQASVLKADSTEQTYYHIRNNEDTIIPTILAVQPKQPSGKIEMRFEQDKDEPENVTTFQLPASETDMDLSMKGTTLQLKNSQITYAGKQIRCKDKEALITGKPHKIEVKLECSDKAHFTFRTTKGKTYHLEVEENSITQITNPEFLDADKETIIYLDPKENIPIKDDFIKNPNIKIIGELVSIKRLEITDKGIAATLQGNFERIEIAETRLRNTALDDTLRFFAKIKPYVPGLSD